MEGDGRRWKTSEDDNFERWRMEDDGSSWKGRYAVLADDNRQPKGVMGSSPAGAIERKRTAKEKKSKEKGCNGEKVKYDQRRIHSGIDFVFSLRLFPGDFKIVPDLQNKAIHIRLLVKKAATKNRIPKKISERLLPNSLSRS